MYFLLTMLWSWPSFFGDEVASEISSLHSQAKSHYQTNTDSTFLLLNVALEKSKAAHYAYGEAKTLFILGSLNDNMGDTDTAVNHLLDALTRYIGMEDEKPLRDQAKVCLLLGAIYYHHHRTQEALDFYDKGMNFALRAVDQKTFVKLLHNKAIVYREVGELTKAKESLINKLEMIAPNDQSEKQITFNQLGLVHSKLKKYDQAISYFNQTIALETNLAPSHFRGQAFHNMANTYQELGNQEQAWDYFNKALEELEPLGIAKDLFITYDDMASLALAEGDHELALFYADKASPLLEKVPKTPDYYNHYHLLANCVRVFDSNLALSYSDQYFTQSEIFNALQKELMAKGEGYKIDLITTNYFNKQKQYQQRQRIYWTLACSLIFLLIAGLVSSRLWKIYRYKSPHVALSMVKNQNEMIYLMDMFRKEKEEFKNVLKQIREK